MDLKLRPKETIRELANRIQHDAVTCDFQSIKDPPNEVMRTRFIYSVDYKAVLKVLFKLKHDELTFAKAIQVVHETEQAARMANETVYGQTSKPVYKLEPLKCKTSPPRVSTYSTWPMTPQGKLDQLFSKGSCGKCGKKNHTGKDFPQINDVCHYCQKRNT